MQPRIFDGLKAQSYDIPLPSMKTARIFQDGWKAECRGAMEYMKNQPRGSGREAIADLMIDRALFALKHTSNTHIGLYAAAGALTFVPMRRCRFLEVKEEVMKFFNNNPPDSVQLRLERMEESMYRR